MITILTPTYNRASLLPVLYQSLERQTFHDFEWLIIDDGSTDNTKATVERFQNNSSFTIRYIRQENGGKHRAINQGAKVAKGEWFFVVDSDDSLPHDSLEIISKRIETIKDDNSISGILCLKEDRSGRIKDPGFSGDYLDQYPHKIDYRGDFADISKTDIIRQFPFPDIPGENFCAECLVIFRISQLYKMRFFKDVVYTYEYLDGGLTDSSIRNRRKSAGYTILTNIETMNYSCPLRRRLRAAVNFWRFIWFKKISMSDFRHLPWFAYMFILCGISFLLYDNIKLRKS